MNKYIKNTIFGAFGLVLIFVNTQNVNASSIWNNAPSGDCPDINIASVNTSEGYNSPCWNGTSINAKPGEIINIKVYYHNTSSSNATNTRVKITAPSRSYSSHSFSGQILSSEGNLYTSSVNVNISSSQSLTFLSARWFVNQSSSSYQEFSGNTALTSGVSIGTIAPGFSNQGSVVFRFKVDETVTPPATCSINSFNASPTTINKGSTSTLTWSTSNCTSLNILGDSVGSFGSKLYSPQNTTTYILSASGTNGSDFRSVTVSVNENNPTHNCSLTDFTVNGRTSDTVDYREATTLAWTSNYCNSVSISPYIHSNLKVNDHEVIYPTGTTNYRITAYGNNGSNDNRTVKVTVLSNKEDYCIINDFGVDDREIEYGDETNIEWDTDGCDRVKISNIGDVSRSGDREISPSRPTSYVLTAYGTDGKKQTRSLYVNVVPRDHDYDYCVVDNFSANQNYINSGSPVILNWDTNDCSSVDISYIKSVSKSGSRTVYPTGTTNYLLTAYGRRGENIVRSVSVVVNSIIIPVIPPVYNSCAITTVATNITGNSATLNGMVSNGSYGNSYFEYGTSVGLGQRTSSRFISSSSFSETISGLSPNSIYYFRFVSACQGSTGYGSIDVFRTLGSSVVRPIVIQGTTVIGQTSPVMLKIENRYEAISKGDTIEYTVTYKNIGKSILRNPILQVIVPGSVTVRNTSRGTYQENTRTLTVELDDLYPNEEGVLYIQGHVVSNVEDTAKIVSTALLVYTNTNSTQENAIAYVLNVPKQFFSSNNNLGASAFFGGLFGGVCGGFGLIGWLLLIIIILLTILLIRKYFYLPRTNYNNGVYPPNTH